MGKFVLVARLVAGDLRRRPAQAMLLLLAIAAAATTLTVGLAAGAAGNNPYEQTRASTNGPDIVSYTLSGASASGERALRRWMTVPGVTAHSPVYPVARPVLRADGHVDAVFAIGRMTTPAAIDQPEITAGHWVESGEVVVERSFADALGIGVGQTLTLDGHAYRVGGIAVTAAVPVYPLTADFFRPGGTPAGLPDPGVVWLTEPDARSLASGAAPLAYMTELKLTDPASSYSFTLPGVSRIVWQDIRDQDSLVVVQVRTLLAIASTLLVLLAIASVAVLVGGRMADQRHRVGLLKAVGGTPMFVAIVLMSENLLLALVAAAAGLGLGQLVAPLVTGPSAGLVGSAGSPVLTASTIGVVIGVALAVAAVSTFVPAIRAARTSTVDALANAARAPRRRSFLTAASTPLPPPLLLGLRLAARRLWRSVLSTIGIAVTVSAVIAALAAHGHAAQENHGLPDPQTAQLDKVLLVVSVILVLLAVVNAIVITWAAALDARRPLAVARALGTSPEEAGAAMSAAQLIPALAGALLGIPGGIGLYEVAKKGSGAATAVPPAWALVIVVLTSLAVIAALVAVPVGLEVRRPVADGLRLEET